MLISPNEQKELARLLSERVDILTTLKRELLLDNAGLSEFKPILHFESDSRSFASELVNILLDYNKIPKNSDIYILLLLQELVNLVVGHKEELAFIRGLIEKIHNSQKSQNLSQDYFENSQFSRLLIIGLNSRDLLLDNKKLVSMGYDKNKGIIFYIIPGKHILQVYNSRKDEGSVTIPIRFGGGYSSVIHIEESTKITIDFKQGLTYELECGVDPNFLHKFWLYMFNTTILYLKLIRIS